MEEIGGSNATLQTKIKGIDYAVPKATPTLTNKVFRGWSKNADLSTIDIVAGTEYILGNEIDAELEAMGSNKLNLYAKWEDIQVVINYYENGGSLVSPNPQYKRF